MNLLSIVQELEGKFKDNRLRVIRRWLDCRQCPYQLQRYDTGINLIVEARTKPFIGIACHYDVVPESPGANDNASAIAVALELTMRNIETPMRNIGFQFFFFDEEEFGLKGSKAYVAKLGIESMIGLINLELVGMGDRLALWSLNDRSDGKLLQALENQCRRMQVPVYRFDKIITNTADHISFREAGLREAFTITCISTDDLKVASIYYSAQERNTSKSELMNILRNAPLFQHYHHPSDVSSHINEESLRMVADVIWQTMLSLNDDAGILQLNT
jgi:Zn-dependent M28 family amino/carboxypeptidase